MLKRDLKAKIASSVLAFGLLGFTLVSYQDCGQVNFSQLNNNVGPYNGPGGKTKAVLSLGLMTKTASCVMCHTRINGDVSGFGTMTFRDDSDGEIFGNIYAADQKLQYWQQVGGVWSLNPSVIDSISDPNLIASVLPELISSNLDVAPGPIYSVKKGELHNRFTGVIFKAGGDMYTLTHSDPAKRVIASAHLAHDAFTNNPIIHESEFPMLNVNNCQDVAGTITLGDGTVLNSPINQNLILMHGQKINAPLAANLPSNSYNNYDLACPANKTLTISGQVVINGELVLGGCIKGQGTIYAQDNIYIPEDLKNVNTAFPYSQTTDAAVLQSEALAKINKDMISLGSQKFIVIGSVRMDVIGHPENPPIFAASDATINNLFNWLSTSVSASKSVYTNSFLKKVYGTAIQQGAVALVEANLYANIGVIGTFTGVTNTNIILNGSLMSPNLSLLSAGFAHNSASVVNPFNGKLYQWSELNQDHRLKYTELGYECHRIRTQ